MSRSNSASAIAPLLPATTSSSGTPAAAQRSGSRVPFGAVLQTGQEQPQPDRDGHLPASQGQRDQRLAVRPLAQLAAVLPRHAHRERALLRQGRIVDHQRRLRPAHQLVGLLGQHSPERRVIPGRAGNEMLQLVVPRKAQTSRLSELSANPLILLILAKPKKRMKSIIYGLTPTGC